MAGYRFCRTDDVELLVGAHNACVLPHLAGEPPMTVDRFKRLVREIDLWCSSCMVALSDDEPVAVLLAAKRPAETLVYRVGARPGHERRGHGRHLLASLAQKLAILGPPRMRAEIPADREALRSLLEACGFHRSGGFADFELRSRPAAPGAAELVHPVGLDDLLACGVWRDDASRSWFRSPATLKDLEALQCVAIASDERVEAFLVERANGSSRDILAVGHAGDERSARALEILIRQRCASANGRVRVPSVRESEIDFARLEAVGFRRTADHVAYGRTAAATGPS